MGFVWIQSFIQCPMKIETLSPVSQKHIRLFCLKEKNIVLNRHQMAIHSNCCCVCALFLIYQHK